MKMLEVQAVSKQFGNLRAAQNVAFHVAEGEIYGLLGPNGAGKTTTISMISGLLRPDAGRVLVGGADVWTDSKKAKAIMGVAPQELAIYEELSARENLEFWGQIAGLSRSAAKSRAVELLDTLALTERGNDPVKNYSGGMKRRVNIGCALAHRPKLLLLDEPTVGIDPQARSNILELVRKLSSDGAAILYTTHYLEEAEHLCNRVGIIDQGQILAEGTLNDLQKRLSRDRIFLVEGDFQNAAPEAWPGFSDKFRIIQKLPRQLSVAALDQRDPADCLRDLLHLPVPAENVMLKKPSLNDVFLQLTGRDLRE